MITEEQSRQVEESAYKIKHLAAMLVCFTEHCETGATAEMMCANRFLTDILEEVEKITAVF